MENINQIWSYACSGETENLRAYYNNGGEKNRRYEAFGQEHSLIAGAYRNGQFDTVEFLLSVGETIMDDEQSEILAYINRLNASQEIVSMLEFLKHFMKTENWLNANTPEQARALFTSICLIGNYEADTKIPDGILHELYIEAAMEDLVSYYEFESFMYGLIV